MKDDFVGTYRDNAATVREPVAVVDVGLMKVTIETLPPFIGQSGSSYGHETHHLEIPGIGPTGTAWHPDSSYERLHLAEESQRKDYIRRYCTGAEEVLESYLEHAHKVGFVDVLRFNQDAKRYRLFVPCHRVRLIRAERAQHLLTYRVPRGYELDESQEKR